jgi:hypothetical protein
MRFASAVSKSRPLTKLLGHNLQSKGQGQPQQAPSLFAEGGYRFVRCPKYTPPVYFLQPSFLRSRSSPLRRLHLRMCVSKEGFVQKGCSFASARCTLHTSVLSAVAVVFPRYSQATPCGTPFKHTKHAVNPSQGSTTFQKLPKARLRHPSRTPCPSAHFAHWV